MSISQANRAIANYVRKAFGGTPIVNRYHHDSVDLKIDVLRCIDKPCEGVTSYSSIGLSDSPMLKDGKEFPTRIEIVGACATDREHFANVIASICFSIMRTNRFCHPGTVLRGFVSEYFDSTTVPHAFLTSPFLWESDLRTLQCDTKQVSWLLLVPISVAESKFLHDNGDDALEDLFEQNQIDIFDLERPSVI